MLFKEQGKSLGKNISVSGLQGKLSEVVWIRYFLHRFLTCPFKADTPVLGGVSHGQKLTLALIRPESRPMSALFSFYSCGSWFARGPGIIQFLNWAVGSSGDILSALGDKGSKGEQTSLNLIP